MDTTITSVEYFFRQMQ